MRTRIKNLPQQVKVWKDRKENTLELHIKKVMMFDSVIANLLSDIAKIEKAGEEDLKFNIPF